MGQPDRLNSLSLRISFQFTVDCVKLKIKTNPHSKKAHQYLIPNGEFEDVSNITQIE